MITLHDLILSDLMSKDDFIYFHFKTHHFQGKLSALGCIYETRANGTLIFHDRNAFDNISEWADNCIQNIAKEYVTRFSSWKRISHENSGLSLHTLRQLYNHFACGKLPLTNQTLTTFRECLTSSLVYISKLEAKLKHQHEYIKGNLNCYDNTPVYKPKCLQKIEYMHNDFLMKKFSTTIE